MGKYYKVEVTEFETDVPFRDKEYKVVGEKENGDDEYDYVYFDSTKTVEKTVLTQTLDELDVSKLAIFINKGE